MSEITKRTRIGRPSSDSSDRNSPRPSAEGSHGRGTHPAPDAGGVQAPQRERRGRIAAGSTPAIRPAEPETSSSTRLARPSQTGMTTVVPLYSTHSSEPLSGLHETRKLGRPRADLEVEIALPVAAGVVRGREGHRSSILPSGRLP